MPICKFCKSPHGSSRYRTSKLACSSIVQVLSCNNRSAGCFHRSCLRSVRYLGFGFPATRHPSISFNSDTRSPPKLTPFPFILAVLRDWAFSNYWPYTPTEKLYPNSLCCRQAKALPRLIRWLERRPHIDCNLRPVHIRTRFLTAKVCVVSLTRTLAVQAGNLQRASCWFSLENQLAAQYGKVTSNIERGRRGVLVTRDFGTGMKDTRVQLPDSDQGFLDGLSGGTLLLLGQMRVFGVHYFVKRVLEGDAQWCRSQYESL